MFVKELKLFNQGLLILAANERAFYYSYKLDLARFRLLCYSVISAFKLLSYTITFFAMKLTSKWTKKFQYKKNK